MIIWFIEATIIGAVFSWLWSMWSPGIRLFISLSLLALAAVLFMKFWSNGLIPSLTCAVVHSDFMEECHVPMWDWDNYKKAKREGRRYVLPEDAASYGPYEFK